jgi:hypothetical protein
MPTVKKPTTGAHCGNGSSVPRVTLTRIETARCLGVSIDFFNEHIEHELRSIRRGRVKLYPVSDLKRWIEESASRVTS